MKRKILTVLAILLGLAGLGVLLYPSVSNWMEQAKQRRQIAAYQEAQAQMEQKRRAALLAEADRYNQKLAELGISFDMLGEAEKEALLIDGKSYDELLLAEDSGVMGYLEIPAIRLKLPIYHGTGDFAICNGAGHVEGSSFPIGGKGTHAVLSSHRGLPGAKLFSDLDKLKVYDKYAMFLHGNNGLSRVEGDGEGKILVIKDSYANSFVPYLTANYAAIDVVDFRNYNYGLDQLIAANDYDQILVLYSYASFTTDPYLYRAGVAG